ncbi:MAG: hypothetical protein WCP29_02830 [Acidobacteriota bacterium]
MSSKRSSRTWRIAALIGVAVFLIYNANGREIDVGDSVPSRLAAKEAVLRHTFLLDHAVAETPEYEGWPAIVATGGGHFRSAYSFAPAAEAALVGVVLHATGLVDLEAPRAASLVAKLTASLLTALATVLAFFTARRRSTDAQAVAVAVGFGLGTGLWPTASQTLWQHETAIFGLMAAVWLLDRDADSPVRLWAIGLALGLAGMARAQVAPAIAILALAAIVRTGNWRRAAGLWPLAAAAAGTAVLGIAWYGHPLGPRLEMLATMPESHMVAGTLSREPWVGAWGLLASPNRGLLVFSPAVIVVAAGWAALRGASQEARGLRWIGAAAVAQFATYAAFSVWWAGYTYGPRYLLDLLPMLVPFAAVGTAWVWGRRRLRAVATALLAWSIAVSAVGAFCYSATTWNTDPEDVDLQHERIWDWRDSEIARCVAAGWHADNFTLFDRSAVRQPPSH